jgi:hypothetical protein
MAKCGYCNSTILLGGVNDGARRFCNKKCHYNAYVLSVSQRIPPDVLERRVEEVWRGNCPKCRGLGPIDVHKYYEVWSALVLTRWSSGSQLSCRSCASKRQVGAAVFSLFCGWWGFPWGLVMTPIVLTRNVVGMFSGPAPSRASEDLRKAVLVNLGSELIASSQRTQPPPVPK